MPAPARLVSLTSRQNRGGTPSGARGAQHLGPGRPAGRGDARPRDGGRRGRPRAHLRRVPRRGRAGRRGPGRAGASATGTVVSWHAPRPGSSRWCWSAALARLGAVQNPILPIYREREVGFIVRQAGPRLLVVPSTWRRLRLRGDGRRPSTEGTGTEVLVVRRHAARGRPGDPAARPADDMTPRRRAGALALLHVRHDRRAQGRPPRRPHAAGRGDRHVRAARPGRRTTGSRSCSRSPTSPAASTLRGAGLRAARSCCRRRSTPRRRSTCCAARTSRRPARARSSTRRTWRPSRTCPTGEKLFPHVRTFPGGGAPKPPQPALRAQGRVRRRRRRVGLRA